MSRNDMAPRKYRQMVALLAHAKPVTTGRLDKLAYKHAFIRSPIGLVGLACGSSTTLVLDLFLSTNSF